MYQVPSVTQYVYAQSPPEEPALPVVAPNTMRTGERRVIRSVVYEKDIESFCLVLEPAAALVFQDCTFNGRVVFSGVEPRARDEGGQADSSLVFFRCKFRAGLSIQHSSFPHSVYVAECEVAGICEMR